MARKLPKRPVDVSREPMDGRWYPWTGAGRPRAAAAPKKDTTPRRQSTRPNRNEVYLGPLAPLHAPLLLLLLALRVPDPLLDVVRVDLEVLLLVEALDDFFRR